MSIITNDICFYYKKMKQIRFIYSLYIFFEKYNIIGHSITFLSVNAFMFIDKYIYIFDSLMYHKK